MASSARLARKGLILWTTLFCFALLELGVRLLHLAPDVYRLSPLDNERPLERVPEPKIGYAYKAHYRDASHRRNGLEDQTNSWGYRDVERSLSRTGRFRIAVLGDSVVDGNFSESTMHPSLGLYDVRDTIPLKLEETLGRDRFEVLNMGVNGYCSLQEAELFRVRGRKFRPDQVVVVFSHNDFGECFGMMPQVDSPRRPLLEFLYIHVASFRAIATHIGPLAIRSILKSRSEELVKSCTFDPYCKDLRELNIATELQKHSMPNSPADIERLLHFIVNPDQMSAADELRRLYSSRENVQEGLEALKGFSKSDGFKMLLVIWPCFTSKAVNDECHVADGTSGELAIEKITQALGIRSVRLSRFFQEDAKARGVSDPNGFYTVGDRMHPNPTGAESAARFLRRILAAEGGASYNQVSK